MSPEPDSRPWASPMLASPRRGCHHVPCWEQSHEQSHEQSGSSIAAVVSNGRGHERRRMAGDRSRSGAAAGVNLAALVADHPLVRNRGVWERVIGALEAGKMPPAGAPQPLDEDRTRLHTALSRSIHDFDYSTVDDPGFKPMRRLSHEEYDNTVRDLFGVDLNPTSRFPGELSGASGFVNSANTLFLQPALMERYIAVAERIVELSLPPAAAATTPDQRRARELVFVATPDDTTTDAVAARRVLDVFLMRAYRRQPTQVKLQHAMTQYGAARDTGLQHEDALKRVLQTVPISPKFLFRVEAGSDGAAPFPLSDWELASRLSYFLWASMPDDGLFDLAARGALGRPAVLTGQVTRMLADPKANTLGDVFAGGWLGFQHVGTRIWLDPIDNPWCTATLMAAMRDETSMFFMSLLRDNQPTGRLIDADYAFVNEELATTLYGMVGVKGDQMRRDEITDPNRGGIDGHASVLALTSNYKDTSPVKRGHYILDAVLGHSPPERRGPECRGRRHARVEFPREGGDAFHERDMSGVPQQDRSDRFWSGEFRLLWPVARHLRFSGARGGYGRGG